jgi:hypothetical protein
MVELRRVLQAGRQALVLTGIGLTAVAAAISACGEDVFSIDVRADAGLHQTVDVGTQVTLDGGNSTGNINSYSWFLTHQAGQSAAPTSGLGATLSFTLDEPDSLEYELTVSDGTTSDVDTVVVRSFPPVISMLTPANGPVDTRVAITGANFSPTPGQNTVTFNGLSTAVVTASITQLEADVPTGAKTGPVEVTVLGTGDMATGPDFFVGPPPSPTILNGTVEDEFGNGLPGLVVRVSHQSGGTGFTVTTTAQGAYSGQLTTGGTVSVFAQGVTGTTYHATNGDQLNVPSGTTVTFDPNDTTGYHFEMTNNPPNPTVSPGGTFQMQVDYRIWNRLGAPGANTWLVLGTEQNTFTSQSVGNAGPWGDPNNNGMMTFTLDAPSQTGTVYAKLVPANTQMEADANWMNFWSGGVPNVEVFVPIGTVTVQ